MSEPNGGPAFPSIKYKIDEGHWEGRYEIEAQYHGIDLRDYFATHAPPMPEQWWEDTKASYGGKVGSYAEAISAWNYFFADAMLAAREVKHG